MFRLPIAVAGAALILSATPAGAGVVWQETIAPDLSGQTNVAVGVDFPLVAPTTEALLTVHGGSFDLVGWAPSLSNYSIYVWEELPPLSGNWVLTVDSQLNFGVETIHTAPTFSTYRFDAGGFYTCYGSGFHATGVCGEVFTDGVGGLAGAIVNAAQPFTLTLYTGVPEPGVWAMVLLGVGGIGATMRMSRRKAETTCAST